MCFSFTNKKVQLSLSVATFALGVCLEASPAVADCAPAAADGVTAVCSGDTIDQNGSNGFGSGGENNVTVEVLTGATVTGTNDGISLNDGAVVDNDGSISGNRRGVRAGGDLRVTNSGSITAIDNGTATPVDGIAAGGDLNLTNSGRVSGSDVGVVAAGDLSVVNSGSIAGVSEDGILAIVNGSVINSGSITGGNDGVSAAGDLSLTNSGRISGSDDGVAALGDMSASNSGQIAGGDAGVVAVGDLSLTNSGGISGGATGVRAGTLVSLTNSGTILGESGTAIQETGAGDTRLKLLPGSVIVGTIDLGGGVNTLDFGGGLNLAATFQGAAPVIGDSNGAPFVVSGTQVIVVDPTGFAAAGVWLDSFATSILNVVDANTGSEGGRAGSGVADGGGAGAEAVDVQADAAGPVSPGRRVWGSLFGGLRDQEGGGAVADLDTAYGGALLGVDALQWDGFVLGGFVGGALSEQEVQADTQDIDTTSAFGGLYLRHDWSAFWVKTTLAGGWVGHDSERRVANNLAPNGIEEAEADYDGYFVIPAAMLGTRLAEILPGFSLEPSLRLHYAGLFLDGYQENGSAADLRVESRDLHQFGGRAQLALPYIFEGNDSAFFRIEARLGIDGRLDLGSDRVDARVAGVPLDFSASFDDEVATGFLGFHAQWVSADRSLAFSGGPELRAGSDGTRGLDGQLTAELRLNF